MKKEVMRLCRTYGLSMRQGKKGIKLYKGTELVGSVHQTSSDIRSVENFVHEVEARCK